MKKTTIALCLISMLTISGCTLFDKSELFTQNCEMLNTDNSNGSSGGPWGNTSAKFAEGGYIRLYYENNNKTHPDEFLRLYYYIEPKYQEYSKIEMLYYSPEETENDNIEIKNIIKNRRISFNEPEEIRSYQDWQNDNTNNCCLVEIPLSAINNFSQETYNKWLADMKKANFTACPFEIDWNKVTEITNKWNEMYEKLEKGGEENIIDGINLTLTEPNQYKKDTYTGSKIEITHKAFTECISFGADTLDDLIMFYKKDLDDPEYFNNDNIKNNPEILAKYSLLKDFLEYAKIEQGPSDNVMDTVSIEIPLEKINATYEEIKDWMSNIEESFEILTFPFEKTN